MALPLLFHARSRFAACLPTSGDAEHLGGMLARVALLVARHYSIGRGPTPLHRGECNMTPSFSSRNLLAFS